MSGISTCQTTGQNILDNQLRIGVKVPEHVSGKLLWYEHWHLVSPRFFAQHPEITNVFTELVGFDDLKQEDKNTIIQQHRHVVNNSSTKPDPMTANKQVISCLMWCDNGHTIKYRFTTETRPEKFEICNCLQRDNSNVFVLYSDVFVNGVARFFDHEACFFETVDKTPKYCTAEVYKDRQMQLSPAKIFNSMDRKVGRNSLPGFQFVVHKSVMCDEAISEWQVVNTEEIGLRNPDFLTYVKNTFGENSKFAQAVKSLETAHQERRMEAERLRKGQTVPRKRDADAECSTPLVNKRPCVAAAAPVAEKQTWIVYQIKGTLVSKSPEHNRPVMTVKYTGMCLEHSSRHKQIHESFGRLLPTEEYNLVNHRNKVLKRIDCREDEIGFFERAAFENARDSLNDFDLCWVRGSAWTQTQFGEPHRYVSPEEIRRAERNLTYRGEKAGFSFFSKA